MHRKLQRLNPALVNRKSFYTITLQKLNELGCEILLRPAYSPIDCHFFKHLEHYLQGKIFTDQVAAENAF
ncbi:Histone-lysine N-methyltransferase SETMAR [Habropoda laboriosa]|uniref:Histone-lysine N-methyltransferase SETMAR n=1 Tax=Habropoda laboriosa TaxID=597456 RepID=A0A0L7R0B4_9HYME|nr:Histone-lysine N-methyltransferase SETMAR [Habropoda laboriosa]KOC64279.1 Histone-lysine N-methyltransferase SETMAR [Habropoda laboriosa]